MLSCHEYMVRVAVGVHLPHLVAKGPDVVDRNFEALTVQREVSRERSVPVRRGTVRRGEREAGPLAPPTRSCVKCGGREGSWCLRDGKRPCVITTVRLGRCGL
eukprot:5598839-Amphidinium_carterae.2